MTSYIPMNGSLIPRNSTVIGVSKRIGGSGLLLKPGLGTEYPGERVYQSTTVIPEKIKKRSDKLLSFKF